MAERKELLPLPTLPTTATNEPLSIEHEIFFRAIRASLVFSSAESTVFTDTPRLAKDSARFKEAFEATLPLPPKLVLDSSSCFFCISFAALIDARRSLRDIRFFF